MVESKQKVNIPKLSKEEPEEKEEGEKAKREEERGGADALLPTGRNPGPGPGGSDPCVSPSEPKRVEEMKGTDQEYSSALTQYNSLANSGGEDIELLAFQTVTGQNRSEQLASGGARWRRPLNSLLLPPQGSAARPSSRTCGSLPRSRCT